MSRDVALTLLRVYRLGQRTAYFDTYMKVDTCSDFFVRTASCVFIHRPLTMSNASGNQFLRGLTILLPTFKIHAYIHGWCVFTRPPPSIGLNRMRLCCRQNIMVSVSSSLSSRMSRFSVHWLRWLWAVVVTWSHSHVTQVR